MANILFITDGDVPVGNDSEAASVDALELSTAQTGLPLPRLSTSALGGGGVGPSAPPCSLYIHGIHCVFIVVVNFSDGEKGETICAS
jgi:hypothetical protein